MHDGLVKLHASLFLPGSVPSFPKGTYFRRFDEGVVEQRRGAISDLFEFCATYPILCRSDLITTFFEV